MSQTSAQDRERAVQMITQRHELQWRIERAQERLKALQGDARQALQDSLATDLAAVAEMTLTLEDVKARLRQEEEHVRRKTDEALRCQDELKRGQLLDSFPGAASPNQGQALGVIVILVLTAVAVVGSVLLLHE